MLVDLRFSIDAVTGIVVGLYESREEGSGLREASPKPNAESPRHQEFSAVSDSTRFAGHRSMKQSLPLSLARLSARNRAILFRNGLVRSK